MLEKAVDAKVGSPTTLGSVKMDRVEMQISFAKECLLESISRMQMMLV